MGVLYPTQSIQLDDENNLSPQATIENEDLSCFLQRMQDLWDSQQPHSLVLVMYCTRTEFLLLALELWVCVICWLVGFQFSVPLGNSWDCNWKVVIQRPCQLIHISEMQVISEEISVMHSNNIQKIQVRMNGPVAHNITKSLAKCLKETMLSDHHWRKD